MAETDNGGEAFDVVIVGCGAAGLAAAVACAEEGSGHRVAILERSDRLHRGGSTRWTGAYMRLADPYTLAPSFVEDMISFSGGRTDATYVATFAELIPETMDWAQSHGLRFRPQPTIFVTRSKPRVLPVGGGEQIVERLATAAEARGVTFLYETTALGLITDDSGVTGGLRVRGADGRMARISARAVVIASGGFEGNPEMLVQYLGAEADQLRNISPGGVFNKGEGIRMALEAGAMPSGEFGSFHAEPIDPRSTNPEAVVMVYPYGVLVNSLGERFVDEGSGTADETYEHVARCIWAQPGHTAFFIGDEKLKQVPGRDHAILTDKPPLTAATIGELAQKIGVSAASLQATVERYNAAAAGGEFSPGDLDGAATRDLEPAKSNWAQSLDSPPYVAYPMACAIVFTYGGIGTNIDGEVLSSDGMAIPGLFAAGECTGLYYGKYPGATSVLRGLVFGRVAGRNAARCVAGALEGVAR